MKLDDILELNKAGADQVNKILNEYISKDMGAQMASDLWIYSSLLKYVKPKNVLEFGCADGLTSSVIAEAIKSSNLDTKLYCFDIDAPSVLNANTNLNNYKINHECFVHDIFNPLPDHIKDLDMVFIDADHGFIGGNAILKMLEGRVNDKFIYFVHDINYFKDSGNKYGIYSIYEEWKVYLEDGNIPNLKTILLTGYAMENSRFGGLIGTNRSRAMSDGDDVKPGKKLGYSMLLSNYLEITI